MEFQRPAEQQQQPLHIHHSRHHSAASAFQEHDPAHLILPAVPSHDLATSIPKSVQLPCLRDLFSPELEQVIHRRDAAAIASPGSAHSLPLYEPMLLSDPMTLPNPAETELATRGRPTSLMLVEDPAVRIAAEALSGLGNPDFVRSPTAQSFRTSPSSDHTLDHIKTEQEEPLLQLFAQAHPWVASTINVAYTTTKNISPGFIQNGANYVERNIAGPVANTVGTVGRFTGVEDGLRKYLGGRTTSDDGTRLAARAPPTEDVAMGGCEDERRNSTDSLPPYRASKPPSYREEVSPAVADRRVARPSGSWPSQVAGQMFVVTSGLGVALSVTSRRSLLYCLNLLSQATEHVRTVTHALQMVLEQYDQARTSWKDRMEKNGEDEASRRLAELIKRHCEDIMRTLRTVVDNVSSIAGGALPENARHFVRTQLMSLPQRYRLVAEQQMGEDSEESRTAHRMIAFAMEGLDMMSKVSTVVQATLDSAEKWLERVGGRRDPGYAADKKLPLPLAGSSMSTL